MTPDQSKQADYRRHRVAYGREFERHVGRTTDGELRPGRAKTYREVED